MDIRFSYDLNGILEVETTVVSTGKKATLVIEEQPGKLSNAELERAIRRLQKLKFHPREALPNLTAVARAEALYVELTGEPRRVLGAALAQIRLALESQDPRVIQEAREQLVAVTEGLRRGS